MTIHHEWMFIAKEDSGNGINSILVVSGFFPCYFNWHLHHCYHAVVVVVV